jgi:site-specific DNA-methyltransferase (adenine-specific)
MLGDCLERLRELPDCSVDSVVTDPPYGLSFMGKKWDYDVPSVEVWAECLRVLKPGGHLLAFAGTRTQHRMAVRIEDAGFEIRDMIAWVYGSGFPKSHDVSKAIDKAAGAECEVVGVHKRHGGGSAVSGSMAGPLGVASELPLTAPATEAAQQWEGWGTALKPALEPITVARKPLIGTVAENVLEHGTGGLNIDGCRVACDPADLGDPTRFQSARKGADSWDRQDKGMFDAGKAGGWANGAPSGRWPANLIHDGSDEVVGLFPNGAKPKPARIGKRGGSPIHGSLTIGTPNAVGHWPADEGGSAARFFYCAKASKKDREGSNHPTMKPTALMRYLCRLVTPPEGVVLDPFMGSGSTGKAAVLEGFQFIGVERDEEYMKIAESRIAAGDLNRRLTL